MLRNKIRHFLNCFGIIFLIACVFSCQKDEVEDPWTIQLKWNPSHPDDSIERNVVALKWCLSFLGSNVAMEKYPKGIVSKDSIITLKVNKVGFTKKASNYLKELNTQLKNSEEYEANQAIDLGRYLALTIGSSNHYYRIVDIPKTLKEFLSNHTFDSTAMYINNSSIANQDRIILSSTIKRDTVLAFFSTEVDSIRQKELEYETVEMMSNGLSRFGLYDLEGNLKASAAPEITRAGKPAKCMWCHETGIQPMFRDQVEMPNYMKQQDFQDTIDASNVKIRAFQKNHWKDPALTNKRLHTEMEISYIAFMEPSAQRLSLEWKMPLDEVMRRVNHLPTHDHEEFKFLKNLYHRSAVDTLAPYTPLLVPTSIREQSMDEPNYLR